MSPRYGRATSAVGCRVAHRRCGRGASRRSGMSPMLSAARSWLPAVLKCPPLHFNPVVDQRRRRSTRRRMRG